MSEVTKTPEQHAASCAKRAILDYNNIGVWLWFYCLRYSEEGCVMKTPEEMAEEWANSQYENPTAYQPEWTEAKRGFLAGYQAAMNFPEKPDSCEHILDMEKMVDVNFSSGWISVKERLPEDGVDVDGVDVLVCVNGQVLIGYVHGMKRFSSEWRLAESGETIWPSHWMPLPAAPKEEA